MWSCSSLKPLTQSRKTLQHILANNPVNAKGKVNMLKFSRHVNWTFTLRVYIKQFHCFNGAVKNLWRSQMMSMDQTQRFWAAARTLLWEQSDTKSWPDVQALYGWNKTVSAHIFEMLQHISIFWGIFKYSEYPIFYTLYNAQYSRVTICGMWTSLDGPVAK